MDYYVLDTETTGFSPKTDSIIEIAAIKVRDSEITDRFETFVNPKRPIPERIFRLTGISDADVSDAPPIELAASELARFLSEPLPIVGHNVAFDLRFIAAAFGRIGADVHFRCVDTLDLARKAFPDTPNYKLDTLIERLGLSDHPQSHRAMDDVMVTRQLLLECLSRLASRDAPHTPPRKKPSNVAILGDMRPTVRMIDASNPLYGENVVFTGNLRISREDAAQIVVNCGGRVRSAVSGKTDFLIVGGRSGEKTGKEKRADAFNAAGAKIRILNELSFFRMIPISAIPDADGIAICCEPEEQASDFDEIALDEIFKRHSSVFSEGASGTRSGSSRDGIPLSPEEDAAVSAILAAVGDLAPLVRLERRSQNYLSLVIPERGRDFCRVKASPRALWMSLDAWIDAFPCDDSRLADVANKNQRHWKIPLSSVGAVAEYADFIRLCAKSALDMVSTHSPAATDKTNAADS